ncbi:flagellar hook assembly protein FlgD [Rosenbergiella australiborealis]|uniref:Basal-body rod modification protein FlgD n=1 Tax=Rosenbergiella australiborealis TaxID=1544696 RepID=A0ABS5T5E7_9GAMM|nr:flagellar hook capping FlgD N-terminal domain-containing protein [Rosenbergiella australiborealis]MBT0727567.1 flagellar hook assembly protein FlgD [Rosenbergiella australiborealis]
MNISNSSTTSANTASSASTTTSTNSQISDMFLQLLVAQIKNQDPTNPTDGKEYVSQLAQLSQVQSMDSISSLMTSTSRQVSSLQKQSIGALTGQKVMVSTTTLSTDGETAVSGRTTLAHAASQVTLTLKDSAGNSYPVALGAAPAGDVNFTVDPKTLGLPAGSYSMSVTTDNNQSGLSTELMGTVKSVRFPLTGSDPILTLQGIGDANYSTITQFTAA